MVIRINHSLKIHSFTNIYSKLNIFHTRISQPQEIIKMYGWLSSNMPAVFQVAMTIQYLTFEAGID